MFLLHKLKQNWQKTSGFRPYWMKQGWSHKPLCFYLINFKFRLRRDFWMFYQTTNFLNKLKFPRCRLWKCRRLECKGLEWHDQCFGICIMFDLEKMTMKKKNGPCLSPSILMVENLEKNVLVGLLVAAKAASWPSSIFCPEIVEEIPD